MRNIAYKHLEKYQDIIANLEELEPHTFEDVVDPDPGQSLLKVIYSIGADGYPVGDLAYFVSNKSNPEVQRFILDNLMQDVSMAATPAVQGLDDDMITFLTRQSGESVQAYASRLNESIQKDKYILDYAKRSVQQADDVENKDDK